MYRVFNMGVGMVWFVPPKDADKAIAIAQAQGIPASIIGEATPGNKKVTCNI